MKIGTYNLHFGGNGKTRSHWDRLIGRGDVDLFFAQESLHPSRYEVTLSPSHFVWQEVPGRPWGSAVFTRGAIQREVRLGGFEGWVVGAEVETADWGAFRAFSVHNPTSGRSYVRSLNEIVDRLVGVGDSLPLVVGGDLNLRSAGPRHRSESMKNQRAETEVFERFEKELGLVNCFTAANPDVPLPQTLRWAKDASIAYHCDVILVPAAWKAKVEECAVLDGPDWRRLSDHNPVLARVGREAVPADASDEA